MQISRLEVHEGTRLVADDGFTCLDEGQVCCVQKNNHGLFVTCAEGQHYLDGQLDIQFGAYYIGFDIENLSQPRGRWRNTWISRHGG